ncbi:MAG: amidase [Pseudonocardiaceae bacterium]
MLAEAEYRELSAVDIAAAVNEAGLSAVEVVDAALGQLERLDAGLRAFAQVWPAQARDQARRVDLARAQGTRLPLAGVPIGVTATEGVRSIQAQRLLAVGCVVIGATSTPRATTSWQTWGHTDRGPTVNPWGQHWSPGGSSAGSVVAVVARIVPLATGSDGAGSVRIPAAWCGVLGLKPTAGLLPARDRAGLTIGGPLAATAADAGAYLAVVVGPASLRPVPVPSRPRVAWSATLGFADTCAPVAAVAADALARVDHQINVIDLPVHLRDPQLAWQALRDPEANQAGAVALRRDNAARLAEIFDAVDLVATPTTPHEPHGHHGPGERLSVALTWAFNLSGHPAISIPAGFTPAGAPCRSAVGRPARYRHAATHRGCPCHRSAPRTGSNHRGNRTTPCAGLSLSAALLWDGAL